MTKALRVALAVWQQSERHLSEAASNMNAARRSRDRAKAELAVTLGRYQARHAGRSPR